MSNTAEAPALPKTYRSWQLFGAGIENVGRDGHPVELPLRPPTDDEILVRIDALGICFSDIKVINQGGQHARLRGRDLANDPTVLGHECACTVAAVGAKWSDQFRIGERYVIQPDIYVKGEGWAFGYAMPGGLAEYAYLDSRALAGDEGCYLLPIPDGLGLSQAGLAEPWACVEASYNVPVRTEIGSGRTLVVGDWPAPWDGMPTEDVVTLRALDGSAPEGTFETIIVCNPDPATVNGLAESLAQDGVMLLVGEPAGDGEVHLDAGAIHYRGWRYLGGGMNHAAIVDAHGRADLMPGGSAIFLGGGGPMGQMHVQRALEAADPPKQVVVTCLTHARLDHLRERLMPLAERRGIELVTLAQKDFESLEAFEDELRARAPGGYDDLVVMVAAPGLTDQAVRLAADNAFINIFAGLQPGTKVAVPLKKLCRGLTLMGTSGSRISDMRTVLDKVSAGTLETNGAVAAIGGINAARDGLEATRDATYPGKIIIYPHVKDFPLTPLTKLSEVAPAVAEKLSSEGAWTAEAEAAFLEAFGDEGA